MRHAQYDISATAGLLISRFNASGAYYCLVCDKPYRHGQGDDEPLY